jgi:hypothetical protein
MAKEPDDRFESAEQFAKVLRMHTIPVAGSGSQIGLPQASGSFAAPGAAPPRDMRRLILFGSLAATVLIAVGVLAAVYLGSRASAPAPLLAAPSIAELQPPIPAAQVIPISITPAATLQATDSAKLMQIANGQNIDLAGKPISVIGQIATIHPTPSGKSMRIDFVGVDSDDFCATCPPPLAPSIQDRFTGRPIRITGVVEMHKTRAEIRVDSLTQLQDSN